MLLAFISVELTSGIKVWSTETLLTRFKFSSVKLVARAKER